ncbi:MAG: hypothetical protein AAF170_03835 [Bacteroidota bacterium]
MKGYISLLVLFLVPAFMLTSGTALAQENEPLINGSVTHGGFGGPVVKVSSINGDLGLFVGGRGGWILNFKPNHAFVIGGGGYTLVSDVEINDAMASGGPVDLDLSYGGLEVEYVNRTREVVHFSAQVLIGQGVAESSKEIRNGGDQDEGGFVVVEPGVNALLKVTDYFRIGVGGSYRLISGTDLDGLSDSELSGASAVLTLKFGSF